MFRVLRALWLFGELALLRRGILRSIRRHGWTCVRVYGEDKPSFSYSVGFWESVPSPDVISFGFDVIMAQTLTCLARAKLKDGSLKLADMALWDPFETPRPRLIWRKLHPSQIRREHLNIAIWYAERRGKSRYDLSVFQLVASDANGVFPWEDGYDQNYVPRQPELYYPYLGPPDEE